MGQPEAAVAIVRARSPEPTVLLLRRSERANDPWSGHWCLPGGRREPHDAGLLDTALRELHEESGIRLSRAHLRAEMPHSRARRTRSSYIVVAPFLFDVEAQLEAVPDPREAVEALWCPMDTLRNPALHALRPVPGRSPNTLFPSIDLNGVPLWGFTYRLLTDSLIQEGTKLTPGQGEDEATRILEFLLAGGLHQTGRWQVDGPIPVVAVLRHFAAPAATLPRINMLQVDQDAITILGPTFEEWIIRAAPID